MPGKLWFRGEDVLPLAEHALACPTHRLTRAQLAAGEHNTPALILRRTGSEGQLRSNGVPLWYSPQGDEQVAHGGSWRRQNAPAEPDQHLYLPLRHVNADGRRLIDILRAGRDLDQPWLAIDTDTWPGTALDARAVTLLDYRAEIAPPGTRWRPAMVTSARTGDGGYPALVADGCDTGVDGHLICRFHPHTVRRMAADLAGPWRLGTMPGEYPLLRFDGTTAVLLEESDLGDGIRLDVDDRCYPDQDGYYSIGAYRWLWHTSPIVAAMPVRDRLRLHLTALSARLGERAPAHRPPRPAPAAHDDPPF
ncbi:hypothetical protein [Micromonospora endolithica]|uniref:hypothetical protein n=1 Tax=Micromonospora endolithica TaxID=230091 RepID=UPI0011ADFD10|nr:hypothetical protein [Micromonospora endolithica]TWJ25111.1 hypothetical protein JD76_05274 [Micromonospora endolithica]